MSRYELFTSESVTEGHPDKVADRLSDEVLDAVLAQDPYGRVACECLVTSNLVVVAGELTTTAHVDVPQLVRDTVRELGYRDGLVEGFDADSLSVLVEIDEQSPDIARGVSTALEVRTGEADQVQLDGGREAGEYGDQRYDLLGAGDQGMVFGYACDETDELMPLPISLAHALARRLAEVRKSGALPYLRPDGKAQVTVRYEVDAQGFRRPVAVERVLLSTQHEVGLEQARLRRDLAELVVAAVVPEPLREGRRLDDRSFLLVNPAGSWAHGGPAADTGLTGRKIIVDTYGGYARHGGGAFSGKDPTKVDRSGAYAARRVAKSVVAAGLAGRCEVQVAYAIGVAQPFAVSFDCFGTERASQEEIESFVAGFDLRPAAVIEELGLRRPIYAQTANYGHFGRSGLPWEEVRRG